MDCDYELTVPFHDVDSMGIVWHGHYAKYFELARCELLDRVGFGYKEMALSGWGWPVIDMQCKYVQPLVFDQRIRVNAKLVEWEYRLRIKYLIFDAQSNRRTSKGYTVQVPVDRASKELIMPIPSSVQKRIRQSLSI